MVSDHTSEIVNSLNDIKEEIQDSYNDSQSVPPRCDITPFSMPKDMNKSSKDLPMLRDEGGKVEAH